MNPLRQRMLEDMEMRNLSPTTQRNYVRQVAQFARHFDKSPDQLGPEELFANLSGGLARDVINGDGELIEELNALLP